MQRILSLGLMVIVLAGILYACNIGGTPATEQALLSGDITALELKVQPQSGTYNTVGQSITYQYIVTNTGTTAIAGPVTVADSKGVTVGCPAVNTVGNLNDILDAGESVTCTALYSITQADLNNGSVTSTATASASGVTSNIVTTNVPMTPVPVLELTSNPTPASYSAAGQAIAFAYVIRNAGTNNLGPAQFVIKDDRLGTINCGPANTTLTAGASLSCSATYTTTDADRTVNELVFNTVASGGGALNNQPVQKKITNTAVVNPSGGYTRGTTIQHTVKDGEWMIQIARCYGADFDAVRNANRQYSDLAKLWKGDVLTIPNIGSNGEIFAPDCIVYYTAQSGDTWNSIASKYKADLNVLLEANKGVTLGNGVKVRVPQKSATGTQPPVTNEPIRLNFTNTNKVTRSGTLSPSKIKDRHVLTAVQGQTISVTLTAPAGGLELAILSISGTALKPQNGTLTYSGTIPSNGDYYVDVVNISASDKTYTLEVGLSTPTTATSERVIDINPGPADGNPAYLTIFNNALYFRGTGLDNAGAELWTYNGATLTRVKDIFPGPDGSNPSFLTVYGGALYFSANGNDGAGVELWRFNGTDVGRLSDINTGPGNANPSYMTEYNGRLYFSASSSDGTGIELWQTDGTTVTRVIDIYSGSGDANPSYLAVFNGALYFSAASNDGFGTELWKFDGAGVSRVTDINTGVGNANPSYMTVFNGALYFSANANDGKGTELWKYDGTNATLAADINPGAGDSIPAHLKVFNGALYFSANGNDGKGYELWKFDGTTASLASDINPGAGDSLPSYLFVYNNQLYFQANGGDGAGRELWKLK